MPTYLGAIFLGFLPWIILFYHRRDLRHKMLLMGAIFSIGAFTDPFFIPEYWNPTLFFGLFGLRVDILALLFGFEFGGIAAVLYEEILKRTYARSKKKHPLKFLILLGPIALVLLKILFPFNFMVDTLIATSIMILVMLCIRKDLFIDAILSGLLMAIVYSALFALYVFLFPDIIHTWNFRTFPQVLIFSIPHYEIVWAFITGAFIGPLYEFSHDYILRKVK